MASGNSSVNALFALDNRLAIAHLTILLGRVEENDRRLAATSQVDGFLRPHRLVRERGSVPLKLRHRQYGWHATLPEEMA